MKNLITIFILSIIATLNLQAQNAEESTISILKVDQPCVKATYNVSEDVLSTAWNTEMAKYDIKKSSKVKGGFQKYSGVNIPSISADKIDLYIKMDGKKDNSSLTVLVSKGYDNFVNAEKYPEMVTATKNLMNDLVNGAAIAQLKAEITNQEKVVEKAEKSEKSSIKSGEDLADDMKKLEKRIEDNKSDQEKAKQELEKENKALTELKAKLESIVK
jgi:septal ring factor EnvC (AmiA/AmiB activator)